MGALDFSSFSVVTAFCSSLCRYVVHRDHPEAAVVRKTKG